MSQMTEGSIHSVSIYSTKPTIITGRGPPWSN